ncbi:hypothetical protein Tco_1364353 [Tanacetum coccineum]
MELLMIEGKTLKGRRDPLGIITNDRKAGIGSPHTEDQTMDCSLTCPKAQERSSPQKRQLRVSNSLLICLEADEAVKSGQLSYLVKEIKKKRVKTSKNQRTEGKKDKINAPAKTPILMIRQDESYTKNKFESLTFEGKEITFPSGDSNSSTPVVIKAKIFGREVNRVHMDGGSSCEVIYEHCFMKLKPSIRASEIDSKVHLVGLSGEKSWSIGKIPLEIMIGRTTMQRMGIIVSTIHGTIKFHTVEGIGTVFSTYESDKVTEGVKKVRKTPSTSEKGVFSCTLAEEKANADVFAWTHADMTGIPRTIMVKGKPFNTEQKLNEYSHVKLIKQKRRGLGPDRSTTACKEVEELMKARILQKNAGATYQRLVDKVFHDHIGRNHDVYVNDMVIKCTSEEVMLADIKETFEKFRSINMKLNPKKCSFGVEEGPFLGHLITKQGIRANPTKGAKRSIPFFKVLKSCTDKKDIQWTKEAEAA